MNLEFMIAIVSALGAMCLGVVLGVIGNKLTSNNEKGILHYYFYAFSIIVLIITIISSFIFRIELSKPNYLGLF